MSASQSILFNILRHLLAQIVVVGHGFGFFLRYFDGFFPNVVPYPQSIAVVCFFYISGFLIVGSQLDRSKQGKANLRCYLFDRLTRVYVTLVPSLIFVMLADIGFQFFTDIKIEFVVKSTNLPIFITNLLLIPPELFGTIQPIWSLMYEWWIYAVFGGLYFFKTDRLLAILLVLVGLCFTLYVNIESYAGHIWIVWVLGGCCAYFNRRIDWQRQDQRFVCAGAAVCLAVAGIAYGYSKDAYNLTGGIAISLFLFVTFNPSSVSFATLRPIQQIASRLAGYSFTLFLTHYTVMTYLEAYFYLNGWMGLLIGVVLSNVIAYVIAVFTEFKLREIRTSLFKV